MYIKTLLAVFAVVIAVGFVAANSITPQASGSGEVKHHELVTPGHVPFVGGPAPFNVPPPHK
jgi:hypothetical protein